MLCTSNTSSRHATTCSALMSRDTNPWQFKSIQNKYIFPSFTASSFFLGDIQNWLGSNVAETQAIRSKIRNEEWMKQAAEKQTNRGCFMFKLFWIFKKKLMFTFFFNFIERNIWDSSLLSFIPTSILNERLKWWFHLNMAVMMWQRPCAPPGGSGEASPWSLYWRKD